MKRGYKRLLIFEIVIILIYVLNSFVSSILGEYSKVLLLIGLVVIFSFLFGIEKDKHHLSKIVIIDILIFLLLYFILYYLLGLIISFTKPVNYYTFNGIFKVIIPLISTIIIKEFLRYMLLRKSEGSKLLLIVTVLLFITMDVIDSLALYNFNTNYNIFLYLALCVLPSISKNILCSYISYNFGYKPTIIYLLIMELYPYLLPIIPNPSEYIYSIINFIVPFILLYKMYNFIKKGQDEHIIREYHKNKVGSLILPSIIVIILVYFTSGYFHYHAIVIASGSMTPNIHKGDVVVIEKIDGKYSELKLNQVLAYRYKDIIVVHRLVKIICVDGEYYFFTKGDANETVDNYKITEDMVIGTVNVKIPYIGCPTVWLKNL